MSFQAYTDNIKAKTGKTLADFKNWRRKKNLSLTENLIQKLRRQKLQIFEKDEKVDRVFELKTPDKKEDQ